MKRLLVALVMSAGMLLVLGSSAEISSATPNVPAVVVAETPSPDAPAAEPEDAPLQLAWGGCRYRAGYRYYGGYAPYYGGYGGGYYRNAYYGSGGYRAYYGGYGYGGYGGRGYGGYGGYGCW